MKKQIPEVRQMFDCGQRFLLDDASIHELHGCAQQLQQACRLFGGDQALSLVAQDWITMSYRYWNEWGDVQNPITKEELKSWLREQLIEIQPNA